MSFIDPQLASSTIQPIQYLRGVAAMMVVWHHARLQFPSIKELFPGASGASGVDLFFVISGFIMVVTTDGAGTTCKEFIRRRLIRVAPLYWVLTLAMVALWVVAPSVFKSLRVTWETLLLSLAFVPHFSASFPGVIWPLLVPGWTLNFEMFFYLVFGLLLLAPPRWRLPSLTALFVALAAFGIAAGPFDSPVLRTYTSFLLLEFVAGAWIGHLWLRGHCNLSIGMSLALVGAGFVILTVGDVGVFERGNEVLGAAMVVGGVLNPRFARLSLDWLSRLGDSSYSLYLTHLFTLGVMRLVWASMLPIEMDWALGLVFMVTAMLACAIVGYLTYRWLERPMLRKLQSMSVPRPQRGR
jgi:exopolysaccharide production protein ExoZ